MEQEKFIPEANGENKDAGTHSALGLTARQREARRKAEYDKIKDIKDRLIGGKQTTFAERNFLKMYEKKVRNKTKVQNKEYAARMAKKAQ